jgi:hypothetical protein
MHRSEHYRYFDHLVGAAEQRQRDSDAVGCRRKSQQQNPAS